MVSHEKAIGKQKILRNLMFTKENQYQGPGDPWFRLASPGKTYCPPWLFFTASKRRVMSVPTTP